MDSGAALSYPDPDRSPATLAERRLIVFGMWLEERAHRSLPLTLPWMVSAQSRTSDLSMRNTFSLTSAALGQELTDVDRSVLVAYRDLTPLMCLPSAPAGSRGAGVSDTPEAVVQLVAQQGAWRRAVVYRWLRIARAAVDALNAGVAPEPDWLSRVVSGLLATGPGVQLSADVASDLLDATLPGNWRLPDLPVLYVEVGIDGPLGPLMPGLRWYPDKRLLTLRAAAGHLVVTGLGVACAMRSGPGAGSALRTGVGHGDAVRTDSGNGSAVRLGPGHGCARRLGMGNGCAVRDGYGHGHAVHDSVGSGGAMHLGTGVGSAFGGFAVLRGGLGPGDAYTARATALRTGFGSGNATTRGPGRAERHGLGSGDAWLIGQKEGSAVNSSAGSGDAVNHGIEGDAAREGAGSGCAWVSHAGAGTAERSGDGCGSASRSAHILGSGNAVRSGAGIGIANFEGDIALGMAICGDAPLMVDQSGWFCGSVTPVELLWDAERSLGADRAALREYVAAPRSDCPVVRVKVFRKGVWAGGKRAGVRFLPERNLFVLDSSTPMTLHVSGAGHADVLRTGDGAGDAVRSGNGYGDVRRLGAGDGSAVRLDHGAGDAFRGGSGAGHAWVGPHALGNAVVSEHGAGHAVNTSQHPGSAVNDSAAVGSATRIGRGSGDASRRGSGDGHAQRGGGGVGDASRTGTGSGTARRWGVGSGNAVNTADGQGDAWRTGLGSGDGRRLGTGNGHAGRLSLGSGLALRDGSGTGDALVHPFVDGMVRRTGSGSGAAGALTLRK